MAASMGISHPRKISRLRRWRMHWRKAPNCRGDIRISPILFLVICPKAISQIARMAVRRPHWAEMWRAEAKEFAPALRPTCAPRWRSSRPYLGTPRPPGVGGPLQPSLGRRIDDRRIDNRAGGLLQSLRRQMPLYLVEQPPAQILRLEQVAESTHRGLIRHRLAAEVDADKTPHRLRIVKRLFDRRVRQIEPVLHEIDAQHPLDPDRRAAIARLRIDRLDQPAQRRPRHNPLRLGQKRCPPRRLGVPLKPHCRQRQLLHPPNPRPPIHPAKHYTTIIAAGFCRGSLSGPLSQSGSTWRTD